jgi:hypothetical protein
MDNLKCYDQIKKATKSGEEAYSSLINELYYYKFVEYSQKNIDELKTIYIKTFPQNTLPNCLQDL